MSTVSISLANSSFQYIGAVGSIAVPPMSGTFTPSPVSITLPATLAPGMYYVVVQADAGNVVAESNETNNGLAIGFTVLP
ncbi:CARDB domain-containing protein [Corallococcus sp. AB038B]|uniref:CARDB domain-containing protein n=1 Tax=Corallococcus sp. AB038B TaxID=2316718 RepID=UPI000EEC3543|nr:CARDB domain-containing protein [Corallococcus sp. AB038B]RKI05319.1 hypothetical protein D7Y04_10845 [Corallococcus sp. AB038B]